MDLRKMKQAQKVLFLFLFGIMLFISKPLLSACSDHFIEIKGDNYSYRFKVEIADTIELRRQGLMFRENLGATQGMLFLFETPGNQSFWMENTPIPLDIIFIEPDGRISKIAEQTVPYSRDSIEGGSDTIQYVLEVSGNTAKNFGITVVDYSRHPRFNQEM